MRGATFFSYALVAFTVGVIAAPLEAGNAAVGQELYYRQEEAGATYVSQNLSKFTKKSVG